MPETEALRAAAREAAEQAFEKQAHPTLMGKPYSIARLWYTTGYLDAEEVVRADERTKLALDSALPARVVFEANARAWAEYLLHEGEHHNRADFDNGWEAALDWRDGVASSGQTSEDQGTSLAAGTNEREGDM